jgi:hypothetical protein
MVSQAPTGLWGRRVPRAMTTAPIFKKKERGKWTAESMSLALDSIKSGQMNGREASRFYSIPESNIRSWKSKKVKSKKRGPPTTLRHDEEMQEVAHCITLQMLKSKVQQICSGRPTPFKGGMPGAKWWGFFKRRHPHLVLRTS